MKKHYYIAYCYRFGSSWIDKKKLYIGCNKKRANDKLYEISALFGNDYRHQAWIGEYFNGEVMNDTGDYHAGWREVSTLRIHQEN